MKKAFIILALLLAVCGIEGRAAELNLSCTVSITSGTNSAECDGGWVYTDGIKVFVTPRSDNFEVGSVTWTDGSPMTIGMVYSEVDGCYNAPQQSGSVIVTFRLKSESVTVTFDLNGLDGTAPADQQLTLGDMVTKPSDPEHEGFVFHGWFLDQACTTPFDFSTPLDHTMPYQYTSGKIVLTLYTGGEGLYSSGTCGKVDDNHDGSQLRWELYRTQGSYSLVISGNGEMAKYAFMEWSQIKTVVMEEGVTTISQDAFLNCTGLTSVIIPAGVTTIGQDAFLGCTGLTSVAIPASVTTIGQAAFYGCTSLTSVTIPASVTTIGQAAFRGCTSLTSVIIPASVTTIGQDAFLNCTGLTHVYCYAASVPSTDPTAFALSNYGNATLHVLDAAVEDYRETEPWSGFGSIVGDLTPLPKCATPTIAFANGELTFDCETAGVKFVYSITSAGSQTDSGSTVSLNEVPSTYTVSVFAVKDGYDRSDAATQTITYKAKHGDVNGDGQITISDAVGIVDIILGN